MELSFLCRCRCCSMHRIMLWHSEGGEEREWGKIKKCALGHCQGRAGKKSQNIFIKNVPFRVDGVNRFLRWMFELKKGENFCRCDDDESRWWRWKIIFFTLRIIKDCCCFYWMILTTCSCDDDEFFTIKFLYFVRWN